MRERDAVEAILKDWLKYNSEEAWVTGSGCMAYDLCVTPEDFTDFYEKIKGAFHANI